LASLLQAEGLCGRPTAYEKVTFVFTFVQDRPDSGKGLKPYAFSAPEIPIDAKSKNTKLSEVDFLRSKMSDVEIVTVTWNDRKCATK
jgi:hypothetical protein